MRQTFSKSDLRTGHIIETRGGRTGLVFRDNVYGEDAIVFSETMWIGLNDFTEDLYWNFGKRDKFESIDIMKVYKPNLPTGFLTRKNKSYISRFVMDCFWEDEVKYVDPTLVWERKEEREIVKIGNYEYDKKEFEEATKDLKPINK